MAQADGVVANGTGSAVRSDINNQYAALWSNHSGSTEPSSGKVAYQLWADTNSGYLKIRNAANNAWIQLFKLDGTDLADICRLTGSTNNTVCTVTGANAIQGEANLIFDGTNLGIGEASPTAMLHVNSGTANTCATFESSDAGANINLTDNSARSTIEQNGTDLKIISDTGAADANSTIKLQVDSSTKVKIDSTGDLTISDGDLVIGTSGHGIDFSATSDAAGMTSELLDSYEEGTWTPAFGGLDSVSHSTQFGRYTRIGRQVFCTATIDATGIDESNNITLTGLPFTAAETGDDEQRSTWLVAYGGHCSGISDATARFRSISGDGWQGVKGTASTSYLTGAQLSSTGTVSITGSFSFYV